MKTAWGLAGLLLVMAMSACSGTTHPAVTKLSPHETRTTITVVDAPGVVARERTSGEYYLVLLTGSENATRIAGASQEVRPCTQPWQFTVSTTDHALRYNQSRYTFDRAGLNTIIAEDVWSVTIDNESLTQGCPRYNTLRGFPGSPYPRTQHPLEHYGLASVTVYRDGLVVFGDDYFLPLGKKLVASYGRLASTADATYYVQGGFELVNLGPWPVAGLQAASGPVSPAPG